jgi:hypothetical protein
VRHTIYGVKFATTPTPPTGTVTAHEDSVFGVQGPVQSKKDDPELAVAVSAIVDPTGTTAKHVTDGQLIPYVRLVTVPLPLGEISTLKVASVPPPGQVAMEGLSTVTVA